VIRDGNLYCDECHGNIPKGAARVFAGRIVCLECAMLLGRATGVKAEPRGVFDRMLLIWSWLTAALALLFFLAVAAGIVALVLPWF